jgi:cell division protein FtsB
MIKKILLLFTLCSLTLTIWAQNPVNKDVFDQLINKIGYEFVLQSVTDDDKHPEYLKQFRERLTPICTNENCCNAKCYDEIGAFLLSSNLTATHTLFTKIGSYKSKYTEDANGKEQYAIVMQVLKEDSLVQKFISKRQANTPFQQKLAALEESINKTFDFKEDGSIVAVVENPTRAETEPQININGIMNWLGWVSTILLLGAIIGYMLFLRPKYQNRLLELKREIAKLADENKTLADQNKQLTKEIASLKEDNAALFANENMLRDSLARYEKGKNEIKQERKEVPVEPTFAKNEEGLTVYETFYMPVPNRDGSFEDNHKSTKFEWTESVYKFEVINAERTKAVFSMMNDERMIKRAISGYDIYIKPVCRASNAFSMNVSRIATEEKGQAVLNNGVWELEEKVLIRYLV